MSAPVDHICRNCGYYAEVRRRTLTHGWHIAEWGECRKADITKTGVMTPENATCDDFTPDPRRWPNVKGGSQSPAKTL